MKEKQLWAFIRSKCRGKWLAQRHEDRVSVGIPDVSFALQGIGHGWIELKSVNCQLSSSAIVRVPHFTESQRAWVNDFGVIGGGCFVVLAVNGYILLFGSEASDKIGKCTFGELVTLSLYGAHSGKFDATVFLSVIASRMREFQIANS